MSAMGTEKLHTLVKAGMVMKKYLIFSILTLLLMGCDDDSSGTPEGSEGGPCYGNSTCDTGLVCVEDICVTEGTNNANPGELNGPCLTGDVCNEKLVCDNQICKTDNDEDGYHVGNDCDDNDATVYPGTIHDCQSECAYGTMSCNSQGVYTECTADTECICPQAGDTREVECGKCGTATVMCTADLVWEFPTECENEGECYPWESEEEECGNCNNRARNCSPECTWEPWGECSGAGVCLPGRAEWTTDDCTPLGFLQYRECNDSCQWDTSVSCFGDCQLEPRIGTVDGSGIPSFNDEVCIPAGPFIMGSDKDNFSNNPEHIVGLSPYLIDVYEVTIRRYKECIAAGACTEPMESSPYYDIPEYLDTPIDGVSQQQAFEFCDWDGGRTLPTEAQWEKAAKGPYPNNSLWPWGDEYPTCDQANFRECYEDNYWGRPMSVDSLPEGMSYYGLYHVVANVREWVSDYFDSDYYTISPNFDPTGPALTEQMGLRGGMYNDDIPNNIIGPTNTVSSRRAAYDPPMFYHDLGIRCARRAY